MNGTSKITGTPWEERPKLLIMNIEEGEAIQTKGMDNLFKRIIAENFPKLKKERVIQVQEAYRISNCQDKNRNTLRHIIIKTVNA
jgi:hypothetical protein